MSLPPENSPFEPPPPPARERELVERVFLGRDGLRCGWRAALYVSLFLLLVIVLSLGVGLLGLGRGGEGGAFTATQLLPQELVSVACALAAAMVMARIERRRFGDYGMPLGRAFGARLWQGALWGVAEISVLMLLIRVFGGYSFGAVALAGREAAEYALLWGVFFLSVGVAEEFLFRGYLQFTLAQGMGFWPAALLLSLIFGGVHLRNPGEGWIGAASVFLFAIFACLTLRRTGDLWFAIGLHAAYDFGETYIYSVPNSGIVMRGHLSNATLHGAAWLTGGSVGPEGSAFAFAVMLAMIVLFDRLYRPPADRSAT